MGQTLTLGLDEQTADQLKRLSEALGFSKEHAAIYAVRLVGACMREGLIFDMPERAWPAEAQPLTSACNKVLDFPRAQKGGQHA